MMWLSALDIAKIKKSSENQRKCLPISKMKTKMNKAQLIPNKICNESTLQKEKVGGRGHHV
jgi:hypothetical protein